MAPPPSCPQSNDNNEKNMNGSPQKMRGWDEIESLFDSRKEQKKAVEKEERIKKEEKKPRKQRQEDVADDFASRSDPSAWEQWMDDGLGGRFNGEGFTGRVESGVRIFKGHVLDKPDAGTTSQCPFDCDCCYI